MTTHNITVKINTEGADNLKQQLGGVGQAADGLGSTFKRVGEVAAGFLAANIIGKAVSGVTDFISGSVEAASSLGESINAVNVTFKEGADIIHEFGETSAEQVGLSARAFNELATPIGAILKNAKIPLEQTAGLTVDLTKRAADMASVFNVDVDQALDAISSGLRGEANPLERFGVGLSAAAVEARAFADTGKTTAKSLTDQEKALARINIIMEQTNDLAGDFANTSDGLANSQRIAAAKTEELQAKIGDKLIPVMLLVTKAKLALVDAIATHLLPQLEKLGEWLGPKLTSAFEGLQEIVKTFQGIWANGMEDGVDTFDGATGAVRVLYETFLELVQFIQGELVPFITGTLIPIITDTLVPAFVEGGKLIVDALKPVVAWFLDNKPILIAAIAAIGVALLVALGPGAAVVVAIIAFITVLGLVKDQIEKLRESSAAFKIFTDVIAAAFTFAVDFVKTKIEGLVQIVQAGFDMVINIIQLFAAVFRGDWSRVWEEAKQIAENLLNILIGTIRAVFGNIPEAALELVGKLPGIFTDIFGKIPGIILDAAGKIAQAGADLIAKLTGRMSDTAEAGIKLLVSWILGAIESGINAAIDGLNYLIRSFNNAGVAGLDLNPITIGEVGHVSLDVGTPFVPRDMLAFIHKGEAVVPAAMNPFNGGSLGGGGLTINIEHLNASTPAEARTAASRLGWASAAALEAKGIKVGI